MKKKIIIVVVLLIAVIGVLIGTYFYGLTPVSKDNKIVEFKISSGTSKLDIVDNLKEQGLIKSKISLYIYVLLNRNLNLQAGTYEISANMRADEILKKINDGKIKEVKNTFNLKFIEGKRLTNYVNIIAEATKSTKEEVLAVLNDKAYLQELINKYWFLTDEILNEGIYYPLEGYLFADTYELYNGSTIKDIVGRMLDGMNDKLTSLKNEIEASNYSVHEILTLASIVESEGANSDDRAGVAGVFYNRLKIGDSLGSDVTTYYGAKVEMSERDLYISEINDCSNGYNTRGLCNKGKLPIGPISSPSFESIKAVVNPSEHDFYFFVADKNKKTYFTKTNQEHINKVNELKNKGLWNQYK